MPSEIENYVHRIGRTGRCGKTGVATTFINKDVDESALLDLKHLLIEVYSFCVYVCVCVCTLSTEEFPLVPNADVCMYVFHLPSILSHDLTKPCMYCMYVNVCRVCVHEYMHAS